MISIQDLITEISNSTGKKKVLELSRIFRDEQFALGDLIDLTFSADKKIAFKAVWVLENVFLRSPVIYETDIEYLVSRIKDVKHASCQRHYAKIMMHISAKKAPPLIQQKLQQLNLEPVVEQCFDWIRDPKVLVAAKIFASETLFNLIDRYPWIKKELADQVSFLIKTSSAAMQSMGTMLLAKLSLR